MYRKIALKMLLSVLVVSHLSADPVRADEAEIRRTASVDLLFNEAADGLCNCVPFDEEIDESSTKPMILAGYHKLIKRYAEYGITHLLLNMNYQRACYPSNVWDSYWDIDDPARNLTEWPRKMWLINKAGVDPYAVCIRLCRKNGILPWASMRMNDTHYLKDPYKPNSFWKQHPEYRTSPTTGFNFAIAEVRQHSLSLIEEILELYDIEGLELDWMRSCPYFKDGENGNNGQVLTQFMREVDRLAAKASKRHGHPIKIAARIPAIPKVSHALGLYGDLWVRAGIIDTLIVSSAWMPADRDTPLETWRKLIGSGKHDYTLAASMGLWVCCVPGGPVMRNNLESARGFTTSMIDRGADQIYLFNHFNPNDFRQPVQLSDGSSNNSDVFQQLIEESAHYETAIALPRRHILTYHDTRALDDSPFSLPTALNVDRTAKFRIYSGPKPQAGKAVLRIGLEESDSLWQAKLTVQLNSVDCRPLDDLNRPGQYVPHNGKGFHYVWSVAQVAPRVVQFDIPLSAMHRGYNTIELGLLDGGEQKTSWLEIYLAP